MYLSIKAASLDKLVEELKRKKKRATDFDDVLTRVMQRVQKKTVDRIVQGGIPPWAPTKAPSNRHPELQRTLRLLNSLQSSSAISVNGDTGTYMTNVPYAVFQNFGAPRGKMNKKTISKSSKFTGGAKSTVGVPARRFLYLEQDDLDYFKKALVDYVVDGGRL